MISRSDGRNFHLLLADRPLPYPAERSGNPTRTVSACFWYVLGADQDATRSTVVLFEGGAGSRANIFRQIEFIADLLSDELQQRRSLAPFCSIQGNEILELAY